MAMVSAEVKDDSASTDLNKATSAEGKGKPVEAVKKTKRFKVFKGHIKRVLESGPYPKPNLNVAEERFQGDLKPVDEKLLECLAQHAKFAMFFHRRDMAILEKYSEKGYDVDEVEVEIEDDGDEDFLSSLD